jgi:hypothetical protein
MGDQKMEKFGETLNSLHSSTRGLKATSKIEIII